MQMRLQTETTLQPAEVLDRAVQFFGDGYGLKVESRTEDTVYLTGAGGSITISAAAGPKTTVEFVERAWETQMKDFVESLPR